MRLFIITILTVVFSWQTAVAAPPVVKDTKNETASPKTTVPPPPPENYTAAPPSADAPSGEPEPEVNITTKGTETHEEYRVNGRLYMIKVTPAHGKPYYLIDNEGTGKFRRSDFESKISVPMWVIKRF